ncbi:hypothetical protein BT93_G1961 [Corymbia citriodora subsp. variegata]|nr:hypothetical protein BT93_G1961 [Corymbia citriodora subsp. variegata]
MVRSRLIRVVSKLQSLKEAEQAQASIIKTALWDHSGIVPKLISFACLSPAGSLSHAQAIFQETSMDNPFVCNTMIRAYSKSVFPIKAVLIYNYMHSARVECDHFTYNFVLKACGKILWCTKDDARAVERVDIDSKGAEIHCRVLKVGFDQDQYIQNSLLHVYSQCGSVSHARCLFDEMTQRTVASWNIIILAYDRLGDFASADRLLELMPAKNAVSWNTLMGRYIRMGNLAAAKKVFLEMPKTDTVSWNSMIAGYIQVKDYNGALSLFREMSNANIEVTEITLISVLGACAETGALKVGEMIHESLEAKGYKIEGYLGIALVDMYSKCGNLSRAWEVFSQVKMKPVSCWNAMIVGLAVHGYSDEALELFAEMERRIDEVRPNRVTFIGVLIACSHKGLVDKGREFFGRMRKEYKIEPDMKHYGCMVDLLSRWGLLSEAYEMIKNMPFKANSVLWRTLLGACRVYGNVQLAELSFQELTDLEPTQDGDYVLLSNIYSEAQRWGDVELLRGEMIDFTVIKRPGSSNIEMK